MTVTLFKITAAAAARRRRCRSISPAHSSKPAVRRGCGARLDRQTQRRTDRRTPWRYIDPCRILCGHQYQWPTVQLYRLLSWSTLAPRSTYRLRQWFPTFLLVAASLCTTSGAAYCRRCSVVCVPVRQSVSHNREPYKNGWTDRGVFGAWTWVGQRTVFSVCLPICLSALQKTDKPIELWRA